MATSRRPPTLAEQRFREYRLELERLELGERFSFIYQNNVWGADSSRSGPGSTGVDGAHLAVEVPRLLKDIGARSLLDIPCGDFHWMQEADLRGIEYVGADIVPELVEQNREQYGGPERSFRVLDLTRDELPKADVVLCRDCLVHLSFNNITRALKQLKASGSRYLLATSFCKAESNRDIADGDWRVLNFELPPFSFGKALRVIEERCSEGDGAYSDKILGLWPLAGITGN